MRERLEAKGAPPERLRVIPNWVDTRAITPQPRDNEWAEQHELVGRFVVMHSGNVGHAQDLDSLVRAATFLRDRDDIRIVIAGFGARHAEMVALAERLEVTETVRFLPYQKRERLPLSLSSADVHVVGLAKGLAGYVVPSRLYGILSAGRPVIVAAEDTSETARLVREIGCGIVIPPGRPDLLARTIREAAEGALRPRRDGPPRARVRRGGGRPRRRHGAVPGPRPRDARGVIARSAFWGSLGALAWTHAGYPLAMGVLARVRPRPVRKAEQTPSVALVVSAHDEEAVIRRRVENALALDYPPERLEIVVASDGSTDLTDAIVGRDRGREPAFRLLQCPREGKVAAQHRSVRETSSDVLAFTDANSEWKPDALRELVRNLADSEVGYVCGQLRLESPDGANMEGAYWRYEMWVREQESTASSITAGNGAIYAVKRDAYVEDDPKFGHDFGFPYLMEQMGRRAVYEPEAVAVEKPAAEPEDEYGRKVRTISRALGHILTGRAFRPTRPLYTAQLVSHRVLRYSTGILHVALLVSNLMLVARAPFYRLFLRPPARRPRRSRGRARRGSRFPARGSPTTTTSSRRRPSRRSCATCARDAADLGQGEGDALNRAADVAIAGVGLVLASPLLGLAALATKLEDRGPGPLPPDAGRQGRRRLRRPQAPHDGRRRRADRAPASRSTRATAGSRASGASSAGRRSTSSRSSGTSCAAT